MTMLRTFLTLHAATALKVAVTGATAASAAAPSKSSSRRAPPCGASCATSRRRSATTRAGPEVAKWLQDLSPSVELLMGASSTRAPCGAGKGCDAVLALHGATRRRRLADLWEDATADPNHARNVNCDAVDRLAREAARPAAGASSA